MPFAVLVPRGLEEELTDMDETCLRRQRSEREECLEAWEEMGISSVVAISRSKTSSKRTQELKACVSSLSLKVSKVKGRQSLLQPPLVVCPFVALQFALRLPWNHFGVVAQAARVSSGRLARRRPVI